MLLFIVANPSSLNAQQTIDSSKLIEFTIEKNAYYFDELLAAFIRNLIKMF